jgi:hypothetical protein
MTFPAPGPSDQIVITVLEDDTDADIAISIAAAPTDREDHVERGHREPAPADEHDRPAGMRRHDDEGRHGVRPAEEPARSGAAGQAADRSLDRRQAVDVFRLVSLRAPAPVNGSSSWIELDPPDAESGTHDSTCVDDAGAIQDPTVVRDGYDEIRVPLAELHALLVSRRDEVGSAELGEWLSSNLLGTLGDVVGSADWSSYRLRLHSQLQVGLGVAGGTRDENAAWTAGLLRAVHLAALLERLDGVTGDPASLTAPTAVAALLDKTPIRLSSSLALPLDRLSRPPLIADLKIVRMGKSRYDLGSIAHIENVMAGEFRRRVLRKREKTTTTTTFTTDTTTETETDLTTSTQVQLLHEATRAVQESTSLSGGFSISAKYGEFVNGSVDARYTSTDSRQASDHASATYANTITQQAKQRVVERVIQTRTTTQILENDDRDVHSFRNTDRAARNRSGIYRSVEAVCDVWMENYGKRLMLEFLLPEPGAGVRSALATARNAGSPEAAAGPEPAFPTVAVNGETLPLTANLLTIANYLDMAALVGAGDVQPPPPQTKMLAATLEQATKDEDPYLKSTTIQVPDGYKATSWTASGAAEINNRVGGPTSLVILGIGNNDPVTLLHNESGQTMPMTGSTTSGAHGQVVTAGSGSVVPVIMEARACLGAVASVTLECQLTDEALAAWQIYNFDRITTAFNKLHSDWASRRDEARATAAQQQIFVELDSTSHAEVERTEIRRLIVEELLGQRPDRSSFGGGSSINQSPGDPDPDKRWPEIDEQAMNRRRDAVLMLEQAFEWENTTWVHYPYYWGGLTGWDTAITSHTDDPVWDKFLAAGVTRAVAPVRPGFEQAVALYLSTGIVLPGDLMLGVDEPVYLSIAEEIAEAAGAKAMPHRRVALDPVRIPTDLVKLQPSEHLNPA